MSQEQTPEMVPIVRRLAEIERDGIKDDGGVPMALSSDAEVTDNIGRGILMHTEDAIDMSVAVRGLPLVIDHERGSRSQVGIVKDVHLRTDGKLGGTAYFSASRAGKLYRQDVLDGIRPYVSVGAQPIRVTKRNDGVYLAERWRPIHVAIVDVPADLNTGFLRAYVPDVGITVAADEAKGEAVAENAAAAPAQPAVVDTGADVRREMTEIANLGKAYGMADKVPGWLERGLSPSAVKDEILTEQVKRSQEKAAPSVFSNELTDRERREYSIHRAFQAITSGDWSKAGFEREVSDATAARSEQSRQGDPARSVMVPFDAVVYRAQLAGTTSLGGAMVYTQPMEFIELLRNRAVIGQAGARIMTGISGGTLSFPTQLTAGAAAARAENPGSDLAATDSTYGNVTLSPKLLQRTSVFSRQLMAQSSWDVEQLVRDDLAAVLSLAIDAHAINGGGSNEIVGLIANTNVPSVTLGAAGGTIALANIVEMRKQVAEANAESLGGLAFVTNPAQRARAEQIQYFSGTNGVPLWSTEALKAPALVSNQVPKNLTKGTSTTICSAWLYGAWSEVMFALWGSGVEFVYDPYSLKKQALIEITGYIYGDSNVRHGTSLIKVPDAL